MESNWAAENLQTIRTLMERSAVYRRALAPVMVYVGMLGVVAAIAGNWVVSEGTGFIVYWMTTSLVAIAGAFILVRRQALKSGEPFWSPPTRRIANAMFPHLLVGCTIGVVAAIYFRLEQIAFGPGALEAAFLIPIWGLLYGLALNAAGFFMPRGIKLFSWGFIISGLGLLFSTPLFLPVMHEYDHFIMGILFGCSHLAYGIYLYFTEPRKNET